MSKQFTTARQSSTNLFLSCIGQVPFHGLCRSVARPPGLCSRALQHFVTSDEANYEKVVECLAWDR